MPDPELKRGPFIALSQDFFEDPDIDAAGPHATLLYLQLACRIRQLHSDGWIYETQVKRLGIPRWAKHLDTLEQVGLVTRHTDANGLPAWYLPGYLKWNHSELSWLRRKHDGTLGACKRHHTQPCDNTRCRDAATWLLTYG